MHAPWQTETVVQNALILTLTPPGANARINRLAETLKGDKWEVSIIGFHSGSRRVELSARRFLARVLLFVLIGMRIDPKRAGHLAAGSLLCSRRQSEAVRNFNGVIIIEDILLLPLIHLAKPGTRTVVDIRDLSHRLFEHRAVWRVTFGWSIGRLMAELLPTADAVYTVSQGLAEVLHNDFAVESTVVRSIPDVEPRKTGSPLEKRPLRIVYAGRADQNRRIDLLIAACVGLENHVSLDLYLVGHHLDIRRLEKIANQMPHIRLRNKVPMNQLVNMLSDYDFGYAAWPPNTLNLAFALPNKFFEYLLAGTPVIVSAEGEMAKIVEQYSCGVLIDPTDTSSFHHTLKEMSSDSLSRLSLGVRHAQEELTWYEERQKLLEAISPRIQ